MSRRTLLRFPLKPPISSLSRSVPFSRVARSSSSSMPTAARAFSPLARFTTTMPDAHNATDNDQMLFGDMDDVYNTREQSVIPFPWEPEPPELDMKAVPFSFGSPFMYDVQPSPTESSFFESPGFYTPEYSPFFNSDMPLGNESPYYNNNLDLWPHDSEPIPIPSPTADNTQFVSYRSSTHFPDDSAFSPVSFAALHPLPASVSPSSSFDDRFAAQAQAPVQIESTIAPVDVAAPNIPEWASHLFEQQQQQPPAAQQQQQFQSLSPPPSQPIPLLSEATQRPRMTTRRGSVGQIFTSASAPSLSPLSGHGPIRSYSRRADSNASNTSDDRDATVRRKRKTSVPEELERSDKATDNPPLKPVLRPPKLAPSAWQLYFTDWIQRQQASNTRKLNVAQAAKEAGQEYASLSSEEKEPYKQRSQVLKEARERELNAYMSSLTPEDIKRENAYRTAQRKAGKSRKGNIKDPNAPKKPLSAYFMFLQRIRSNALMVQEIFGDETETTKQSVLAAAKWRSMTDDERKPYLAQAEHEKMEYEAARRLYEDGTTGFGGTSINFSILPGSPAFPILKVESESESDISIEGRRTS